MKRHWVESEAETYINMFDAMSPMEMLEQDDGVIKAVHVMRTWEMEGKQIFIVDKDVAEEVFKTPGKISERDMVEMFPYYAAFVQVGEDATEGMFAGFDHTYDVLFVEKEGERVEGLEVRHYESQKLIEYRKLLYYISAINADIEPIYVPGDNHGSKKKRSQATWNRVGFRMGAALRAYKRNKASSERHGGTIRPHMRRAHWHHYWVGPRDGDRRRIVKWLPPIEVATKNGDIDVTGHMVANYEDE